MIWVYISTLINFINSYQPFQDLPTPKLIAFLFLLLLIPVAWWFLFFYRKKRKDQLFPPGWKAILEKEVTFYRHLPEAKRIRFEQDIQQFLEETQITGVGTQVDDTDLMLVAASAVIPLFGFPDWRYRDLNEVLLYDGAFNEDYETRQGEERDILGMVGEGSMNRMMILSKPALRKGFANPNSPHNVGIHEFVHLLDKADGATDGIPETFLQQPYLIPWTKMMHREIQAIKAGHSDIDVYGSTNEAEFFSVVSKYFFQQPHLLEKHHPELFALLEKIFKQDLS